ncbi:fasciclin domain-containing protein [Aliidiomarina sp. Khilg15.8]
MKRSIALTSLAALVAATFSVSAIAHNHGGSDKDSSNYSIVELAQKDDRFSTLVQALQAADLVNAFDNGSFTVFAPTNDAFEALPEGTLENLLEDENIDQLKDILTYHVVDQKVMSSDIGDQSMMVETLQGSELRVMASYGNVMINNATVVEADLEASNGVIHAIDTVLMPAQ